MSPRSSLTRGFEMIWGLLIVVVSLTLGPLGQLSITNALTPNLLIVFLWAVSWFRGRHQTLQLALTGGLLLDLVGFSYFGLWTLSSVLIVLTLGALKERLLDASSPLHALSALAVVSLMAPVLITVATKTVALVDIALVTVGNVGLGVVVYYFLAMRLRLFQRWAGRRVG